MTRYAGPIPSSMNERARMPRRPYARLEEIIKRAEAGEKFIDEHPAPTRQMTIAEIQEVTGLRRYGVVARLRAAGIKATRPADGFHFAVYTVPEHFLVLNQSKATPRRDAVVADAEELAEAGVSWPAAVERLGYSAAKSLERILYRANRGDLIRQLKANTKEHAA